ncbi:MAG: hypothetical protein ACYC7D_09590 [Nitrososphaerales archaeon]
MSPASNGRNLSLSQRVVKDTEELDVNLRSSCLACNFLTSCAVADEKSSPDHDALLGSYRFGALKERCLL